ncbi:MAG: sigma-70 family RNA polymerase sigma factor [Thermodesulfobacteriota bacterium]|nr:sigma-70 family RNA polymerase sigma factor [Thermodesulfobacteriota bacterium]
MPTSPRKSSTKNNSNDTELVRAIQSGRIDLYQELVSRYERKLYNFGLRMCRNASDAEDLVQDTFLNVFKYLNGFRHEAKFKNWLYKIAASTCIKKRRRLKYAPDQTISIENFLPGDEAEVAREIPRWTTIPLDQLLNEELAEVLSDTIHTLPEKYRIVAILRDVEGFSTAETAKILDITPANVKVRLHRARLFLREKLKNYFEHDHNYPST